MCQQARTLALLLLGPCASTFAQQTVLSLDGPNFPGEEFGSALAGPGDLDGLGRPDLVIGRPGAAEITVRTGEGSSIALVGPGGSRFGAAIAGLDDANGDGRAELAVGAPTEATHGADAGAVFVYSLDSGAFAQLFVVRGIGAGDLFGTSVARVPDADEDGVGDFVVGAPQDGVGPGWARLFSGVDGSEIRTFAGAAAGDRFGAAVAGLRDLDGDGKGDVLVGAPGSDAAGADAGRATVLGGGDGSVIHAFDGERDGAELGASVANPGDVDLDGTDDLLMGAPNRLSGALGSAHLRSGRDGSTLASFAGSGHFGAAVAGTGDLEHDCVPDLAIGAPAENADRGELHVFSGSSGAEIALLGGFWNNGVVGPGSGVGSSIAALGDFDGDGLADLAAGGPGEDHFEFGFHYGHVRVLSLRSDAIGVRGPVSPGGFGSTVRVLGDVDGDEVADVLVGTPFGVRSGADGRLLYPVAGSGPAAAVGDVDGDGVPDFAITGAPTLVRSGVDGAVIATLPPALALDGGEDVDLDGTPDVVLGTETTATVYSGADWSVVHTLPLVGLVPLPGGVKHVALVPDVDGDGHAELAVGEPSFFTGFALGAATLYSGADATVLRRVENAAFPNTWGFCVFDAGDFDGDGVPDWGASANDNQGYSADGQVVVFSGADGSTLYDSGFQQILRWSKREAQAFGFDVRTAGDLDLDGDDELLIASPSAYGLGFNLWNTGEVVVVAGGSAETLYVDRGFGGYDLHGTSVDGGIDANGDGLLDVVIGVPTERPNGDLANTNGSRYYVATTPFARSLVSAYCVGAPNSDWPGAAMSHSGSTSIAANDFVLEVVKAKASQSGLFFFGANAIQVPFGDGFRCVGGSIRRLHPVLVTTAVLGAASRPLDFTLAPASAIRPGDTWRFQFWYRDPAGPGGSGFNLSNGLAAVFRP